ncbi:hypothetical protein M011DRAFT_481663 [Sporormia fimetaria CBS 119925]|uniref:Uncharacterized protein n=1 Tax=Sporormia fimetaria CBS 119925 TaxID=1340428 RepID=A0A6A6UYE8_9PLEO|nr:hypothetical protein M011DRAFT_481663 [Sporormia fimetaria CBS 119925]
MDQGRLSPISEHHMADSIFSNPSDLGDSLISGELLFWPRSLTANASMPNNPSLTPQTATGHASGGEMIHQGPADTDPVTAELDQSPALSTLFPDPYTQSLTTAHCPDGSQYHLVDSQDLQGYRPSFQASDDITNAPESTGGIANANVSFNSENFSDNPDTNSDVYEQDSDSDGPVFPHFGPPVPDSDDDREVDDNPRSMELVDEEGKVTSEGQLSPGRFRLVAIEEEDLNTVGSEAVDHLPANFESVYLELENTLIHPEDPAWGDHAIAQPQYTHDPLIGSSATALQTPSTDSPSPLPLCKRATEWVHTKNGLVKLPRTCNMSPLHQHGGIWSAWTKSKTYNQHRHRMLLRLREYAPLHRIPKTLCATDTSHPNSTTQSQVLKRPAMDKGHPKSQAFGIRTGDMVEAVKLHDEVSRASSALERAVDSLSEELTGSRTNDNEGGNASLPLTLILAVHLLVFGLGLVPVAVLGLWGWS